MTARYGLRPVLCIAWVVVAADLASAGTISARREDQFGNDIHESYSWFQGVGTNPSDHRALGWSWTGYFTINNVPAGDYYFASNEFGVHRHNIGPLITVPSSGTVELTIVDRSTMDSRGLADLMEASWAAQEFIATGTSIERVMVLSPNGGSQVLITVREDEPWGPQVGPSRAATNGALFPAFVEWGPDEVPTIPGRRYVVQLEKTSAGPWRPSISNANNDYPNGAAWIDGVYRPEVDLRVAVSSRDDGFVNEYNVHNWWRSNTFSELVQTFRAMGDRVRVVQMMLAGQQGHVMRASVHEWNGSYPYGNQIGPAKTAEMGASLLHGFVWGPEEVPITPGQRYAIRFVRTDGQPFAIYGDSDQYAEGQAYFDGVAENGIDITGHIVTRQRDLGEIVLSNLSHTILSATEVRVTFNTNVATTASVCYRAGSPPFDSIWPADPTPKTSHDITVRHLEAGTAYQMYILAHNPTRNVLRSAPVAVSMPSTSAALSGEVYSQAGVTAGAKVIVEETGQSTFTDAYGEFTLPNVPTGEHTLRVEMMSGDTVIESVDVTPDGQAWVSIATKTYGQLIPNAQSDPYSGWTPFGTFDGQFNNGDYSISARTGTRWVGSITNGTGGKNGGMRRTFAVEPGKEYIFGGWVRTDAWGSSYGETPGLAVARIGVDPTGGTDPASPTVIWARYRFTDGQWLELTVPFTPSGSSATLFCQHKYETFYLLAPWWYAAFDDLWLGRPLRPVPDFDRDLDVDLEDFGRFQSCLTGPGVNQSDEACDWARIDEDDDVDADDYMLFRDCMTGANIAYTPGCSG